MDETNIKEIRHTKAISKKVKNCEHVLAVHTHPHSMPPSAEDFNCFVNSGYEKAAILCHDGTVYFYSCEQNISDKALELQIQKEFRLCHDEKSAQLRALEKFRAKNVIYFKKVSV